MAKEPRLTHHAQMRVEMGDKFGLRTKLTSGQIVERLSQPSTLRMRHGVYIWSPADEMPLYVVTAKGGTVVITLHDTRREPTRMAELILRAREGLPVTFLDQPLPKRYAEGRTVVVEIGIMKEKRGMSQFRVDLEVASLFDVSTSDLRFVETRWFHELIVAAVEAERAYGTVSDRQLKEWVIGVSSPDLHDLRTAPIWISYEVLGLPRPSS